MTNLFDLRVPFFIPLWRRVVITLICLGWALWELVSGAPFWAILFGAIGATAVWQFFLSGWPPEDTPNQSDDS